jgi:inosine-uridine nucleoside N-ribohydrolase
LACFGEEQIISSTQFRIHRGCSRALIGHTPSASDVHGMDGLGDVPDSLIWPSNNETAAVKTVIRKMFLAIKRGRTAVDQLLDLANGTEPFDLLCTGPLTNLAAALQRMGVDEQARFWAMCGGATIMGGAFHVPGNITTFAEFNLFADPEAAQLILNSFDSFVRKAKGKLKRKTLFFIPLDSTETVAIPLDEPQDDTNLKAGSIFVYEALRKYGEYHAKHCPPPSALLDRGVLQESTSLEPRPFCHLHDPLAAWIVINRLHEADIWSDAQIRIRSCGSPNRGQVVTGSAQGPNSKKKAEGTPVKWLDPARFDLKYRLSFMSDIADLLGIKNSCEPTPTRSGMR